MERSAVMAEAMIGDIEGMVASFGRHLRASNLAPRTIETYLEGCKSFIRFLRDRGMPTDVGNLHRNTSRLSSKTC